jgi:Ca-activated chloride channel family protein
MDLFGPDDEVGLWTFSTEQRGSATPYNEQVPIGAISGNKDRMRSVISALSAEGGTALYATARAAQQKLLSTVDPDKINAVVLLTDGKNEYPKDNDLDGLLRDLDANNLENSVRVFTIAYGEKADLDTLKKISMASRAAAYDARNPASIDDVLVNVISNF